MAMIGVVLLAVAYGGTIEVRRGDDPMDALDSWGLVALLGVWLMLYVVRLIFWSRVPTHRQNQIRLLFTALLTGEVLLCGVTAWFQAHMFADPRLHGFGLPVAAMIGAGLSQIGTVLWLLRYRGE